MKQIGNAFPPPAAAVLFECIKHQLLERDGLKPQRHQEEESEDLESRPSSLADIVKVHPRR